MDYTGYLFVHFTGEHRGGEQIYFSISRDGLHWTDLNNCKPVLVSDIGELGVRDPFIIRSPWGDPNYYLIATDLRIDAGKGWQAAQYEGSRDIIVWESNDLLHWSQPKARTIAVPGAGCAWAPECIYDEEKDAIFLYWASMVKVDPNEQPKHRIYSSYTRDFKTFTEPQIYLERPYHTIDCTIIRGKDGYYRFTKNETHSTLFSEFGKSLDPGNFTALPAPVFEQLSHIEGPAIFKFNDREEWCLMVDRYQSGGFRGIKGYIPLVTKDLAFGNWRILEEEEFDLGQTLKRHGGILNITEEEYIALSSLL